MNDAELKLHRDFRSGIRTILVPKYGWFGRPLSDERQKRDAFGAIVLSFAYASRFCGGEKIALFARQFEISESGYAPIGLCLIECRGDKVHRFNTLKDELKRVKEGVSPYLDSLARDITGYSMPKGVHIPR